MKEKIYSALALISFFFLFADSEDFITFIIWEFSWLTVFVISVYKITE